MNRQCIFSVVAAALLVVAIPGVSSPQLVEKQSGYAFESRGFLDMAGALAYDPGRHRLAVADRGRGLFYLFDLTDRTYEAIGEGQGLETISDMAFDQTGNLFLVSEDKSALLKFRYGNDFADTISLDSIPSDKTIRPARIYIDPHGLRYVCDREASRIFVLDIDDTFLFAISDKLKRPDGITVRQSGEIIVADKGIDPIVVFGPRGEFLRRLSRPEIPTAQFSINSSGLAIDQRGWIYTLDLSHQKVVWYDPSGVTRGDWAPSDQPFFPIDLATDRYDNIYISEQGSGRVIIYSRMN